MTNLKEHLDAGDGIGITGFDIQAQRTLENTTAALSCSPAAAKQLSILHEKAAAALEKAQLAEREQLEGIAAIETLLARRAEVLGDIPFLQSILADAEKSDSNICSATGKLIRSIKENDRVTRGEALIALDGLARTKLIAPLVPGMLIERTAAADDLGRQILAAGEKFKVNLQDMRSQFQTAARNEPSVSKYPPLIAGFESLI